MTKPRVVIVYDWLTNMGGGEKLLLAVHKAFPDAPIYTSVYLPERCPAFNGLDIRTTYLQRLPSFLRRWHQLLPVLRAHAFRQLQLPDCDLVLSISSAESKAVRKPEHAVHVCYCFTPTRYYWSHYEDYKRNPGFGWLNPLIWLVIPPFVAWMRRLDLRAVRGVDHFIANSSEVAKRIERFYARKAQIIYPPVDMQRFLSLSITGQRKGFVMVGRQVAYKRFDLAIQACGQLKVPLTIYGNGPEHAKLQALAGPDVTLKTGATDEEIAMALAGAEGFLFPQEEDFGIVQIEAMAAGCPVVAYAKGGSLDAVVEGKTGVFFHEQTIESLQEGIRKLQATRFAPKVIQAHAQQFSETNFIDSLRSTISGHLSTP